MVGTALFVSELIFICGCCKFFRLKLWHFNDPSVAYALWKAGRYPGMQPGRSLIRNSLGPEVDNFGKSSDYLTSQKLDSSGWNSGEKRQILIKRPCTAMRCIMMLFGDKDLIDDPRYVSCKPSTSSLEHIIHSTRQQRSWKNFLKMIRIPDAFGNEVRAIKVEGACLIEIVAGTYYSHCSNMCFIEFTSHGRTFL
jgi:hypothetical protein